MIGRDQAAAILPAHLARQRWFGSGGRVPERIEVLALVLLRDPWPAVVRVVVGVGAERYQVLIGLRPEGEWGPGEVGEAAAIGGVDTSAGRAFAYDALVDRDLALWLLREAAPELEAASSRPIMAEQSNSSIVYDEQLIFKVFRRLTGPNLDIEVTTALDAVGFGHVAQPVAVWRVDGDESGFVQRFLAGGSEGWALAMTSLRDLFEKGGAPDEAGGDFAFEASRIGTMTATLHRGLAEAFGAEPGRAGDWADLIDVRMSSVAHRDLDHEALRSVVDTLRSQRRPGRAIRAHGDYHLGQVMRTDDGWFVLDFEGEPLRPGDERRLRTSPLRDVAGMLRSLHYASMVAAREHGGDVGHDAAAWEDRNRAAFLDAYRTAIAGSDLVPAQTPAFEAVLAAFELDKAVYEVAYEQAHRPDWVAVPLAGVERLLKERA